MIAISYKEAAATKINIYRNGEKIGDYKQGPTVTWTQDDAEVIWGQHHGSGGGDLDCIIHESRIYVTVLITKGD